MSTLSVCLITRNEEIYLSRCLESVRGLTDEIVVVDTGSTDRTVDIARSFGARIFHFQWCDDFSAARNFSIEQATSQWILSIDGDESIAARDHARIRTSLCNERLDAVTSIQRHYLTFSAIGWKPGPGGYEEGEPYPGFVDVGCRRLFRNRPWLRFRYPVHEELVSVDPARPFAEEPGDWVIHHYGKLGNADVLRAKGDAYLRMGAKKVEEHALNPQAHYELGIQYSELGRHDAALACFERVATLAPGFRDTPLLIASCHRRLGHIPQALTALRDAARALPHRAAEILLEQGNAYISLEDDRAAEKAFRRALKANPAYAAASVNLARLYQRTGRCDEALACTDRGIDRAPAHVELRMLRAQLRRAAGHDRGALADLDHLGRHPGALRLAARILVQRRRYEEAAQRLDRLTDATAADIVGLRGAIALGTGDLAGAVAHLRHSMDLEPSLDCALNLSTALEAQGDRQAALSAAAEGLRLQPDDRHALARFRYLAGGTLGDRRPLAGRALTIFLYQPGDNVLDDHRRPTQEAGDDEDAVLLLAESLSRMGNRVVVFTRQTDAWAYAAVECADWQTMPLRVLGERPDIVVSVHTWQLIGQARLAPLQIFWTDDVDLRSPAARQDFVGRVPRSGPGEDGQLCREVDVFVLPSCADDGSFRAAHGLAAWQVLTTSGPSTVASVKTWAGLCETALTVEPPIVERIAVHLGAGRCGLAQRMFDREAVPPGISAGAWDALKALTACRAGGGPPPDDDALRRLALCFPSIRKAGVIELEAREVISI
jgi:tetratricopeptide (TPR) repeat protein